MQHLARTHHRWHAAPAVALIFAALVFALIESQGPFTADDLRIALRSLRSTCETARLTVAHARAGDMNERFLSEQTRSLSEELSRTLRDLEIAEADPALEPRLVQASQTGAALADILR